MTTNPKTIMIVENITGPTDEILRRFEITVPGHDDIPLCHRSALYSKSGSFYFPLALVGKKNLDKFANAHLGRNLTLCFYPDLLAYFISYEEAKEVVEFCGDHGLVETLTKSNDRLHAMMAELNH